MRRVAILGSTGSIGQQTLDVVREHTSDFQVVALSCYDHVDLLKKQVEDFSPSFVCIGNTDQYNKIQANSFPSTTKVVWGREGLSAMIDEADVDIYVIAIVGFAGLEPTLQAIQKNKIIALANKECLVVAGEQLMTSLRQSDATIYPIDSEHSAIFQSLQGEKPQSIEKILLTASGGPFRQYSLERLKNVTVEDAIRHPNWKMGDKITIDSATMMNKGFEIIEAKWLFDVSVEQIQVLIHPQSVIHSAVQFVDGSVKAQMGTPDMRLPIQYALFYPNRHTSAVQRIQWFDLHLTFEQPDMRKFPCLNLALYAIKNGGNMPCILNAANEIANRLFRSKKCTFLDIPVIISRAMEKLPFFANPTIEELLETHTATTNFIAKDYTDLI